LVSLTAVLAGCSKQPSEPAIRLAYVPYSSSVPAIVASERGLFTSRGLVVELRRIESSNEAMSALANGEVDGVMGIGLASLLAVEAKSPGSFRMSWYAVEDDQNWVNAVLVPISSTANSIQDLRGKTIGTFTGATQVMNLRAAFVKALGSAEAIKVAQIAPNLQLQALERKEFDGLFTIEPTVTLAISRGLARVLVDNLRCQFILNPFPAGGGVLSTKLVSARPKVASSLVEAFDEAIQFARRDPGAAKALLPKYISIEPDIAAKSRLYSWWTSSEVQAQSLQAVSDLLSTERILTSKVDVRSFLFANAK